MSGKSNSTESWFISAKDGVGVAERRGLLISMEFPLKHDY